MQAQLLRERVVQSVLQEQRERCMRLLLFRVELHQEAKLKLVIARVRHGQEPIRLLQLLLHQLVPCMQRQPVRVVPMVL